MRFRILGALRVHGDAGWVPVAAEQQRLVLAVLLADVGRVVSTDRLVDAVWEGRPPRRAVNTVQAYVMRLRRLIGEGVVVTRGRGYELLVGDDDVDATVFERLAAEGRRDVDEGRLEAGAARLTQGLALWQGPVFADVPPSPSLAARVAELEQLRLSIEEDHLAALLDLGRPADAVDGLQRLVETQPLRERRWALLMRALDGCGRRAEALEAFQRAHRVLRDELGLEPGPQLRELQRAILAADEPAGAVTVVAVAPAQLPADVVGFTGRDRQLADLDALLPDDPDDAATAVVISAIAGTGGIGKTALAVRWAHRVRHRFGDGQLYINLRGYADVPPVRPIAALARFLRALDVPAERIPSDVDEASALYRSVLADRSVLVLLDNARDPDQVRPLLPGGPRCLALVTSRDRLGGLVARDGAVSLTLDVLSDAEAQALLGRLLGRERVDAEPAAVSELARLCGDLPLALRIAAATLSGHPRARVDEYVTRLAADRLGLLDMDGDRDACVRSTFDLSYAVLPQPARRLLRHLGLVPGPDVTAPTAAALAGADLMAVERSLNQLAAAHLITEDGPGRYGLHDLIRCYALDRAKADESHVDREAALERLYEHYLSHTRAAAELLGPEYIRLPYPNAGPARFADLGDASAWLDGERANVVAAVSHAAAHGPRRHAWLLADALRTFLLTRMDKQHWQTVAEAGLVAARADGDHYGLAAAHYSLAQLHSVSGRFDDAIASFELAADHARRAGWAEGEAGALDSVGGQYHMLGKLQLAAEYLSRGLEMRQRLGLPAGVATTLDNLGLVHCGLGDLERAADHHARAAEIFRELGATTAAARATGAWGIARHALGYLDDAADAFTTAIAVYREAGDRYYLGLTEAGLAEVYRDQGKHDDALDLAEAFAAHADEIGDPWQQGAALATLATIHHLRGDHEPAVAGLERAIAFTRDAGDQMLEADFLTRLARAHLSARRPAVAIDLLRPALAIAREGGYRLVEGQALTVLAATHLAMGEPDEATAQAQHALALNGEIGHRLGQAQAHLVAARALRLCGRQSEVDVHEAAAGALFAEIGANPGPHTAALLAEEASA